MDCHICGSKTHGIKGFCLDRDGIRECRFCPECLIIFRVTCASMQPHYILKDRYEAKAKDRIIGSLKQAIKLLEENG